MSKEKPDRPGGVTGPQKAVTAEKPDENLPLGDIQL